MQVELLQTIIRNLELEAVVEQADLLIEKKNLIKIGDGRNHAGCKGRLTDSETIFESVCVIMCSV